MRRARGVERTQLKWLALAGTVTGVAIAVDVASYFVPVPGAQAVQALYPDAKLGIGDTYMGEGSSESLVLAIAEYQEFLSFYTTHPRADYAQYKIGLAHFRQMRAAQRDQTETRDAVREFETFVARYPNSDLMPEVKSRLRALEMGAADVIAQPVDRLELVARIASVLRTKALADEVRRHTFELEDKVNQHTQQLEELALPPQNVRYLAEGHLRTSNPAVTVPCSSA